MNGPVGTPDDSPEPPDTDLDPTRQPARYQFTKAPLFVLALVMGSLLAALAVQVLSSSGNEATVATSSGGVGIVPGGQASGQAAQSDGSEAGMTAGAASGGGNPSDDESPATSSIDRMNDPEYVTRTIAQGFREDFRGVVDETEAACMAREIVGLFGVDRLWQITQAMAEANANPEAFDRKDPRFMNDDEIRLLNAHLRPCVDAAAARKLDLNG